MVSPIAHTVRSLLLSYYPIWNSPVCYADNESQFSFCVNSNMRLLISNAFSFESKDGATLCEEKKTKKDTGMNSLPTIPTR